MILVDSGVWFAFLVPIDPDHTLVKEWFSQNNEQLLVTDLIVVETLTLLRARREPERALMAGRLFMESDIIHIHYLDREDILAAWRVFSQYRDKDWSFTDCASKHLIDKLGITHAAALDHHFHQFGNVQILP